MPSTTRVLTADRGDAGRRLDLVLRRHLTDVASATRTRVQGWIEAGLVTVNGAPVRRTSARAALGDVVSIALPDVPRPPGMRAEAADLSVLYEDQAILAVDKPAGVVVHPGYRHTTGTLMNALLWRARTWPAPQRPSLVGRLDRLTSGVVIVAKTADVHATLQRTMASADAEKDYLAVVYGRVAPPRGRIDLPLGRSRADRRRVVAGGSGAPSRTHYERLARVAAPGVGLSLMRCRLTTGRMHQIRVHLAARGWPIVGDPEYGAPRWRGIADPVLAAALRDFPRQALHAWHVAFTHPVTHARIDVEAPIPDDMRDLIRSAALDRGAGVA